MATNDAVHDQPLSPRRVEWLSVAADVREQVEQLLGARIESAINQAGGFSPGPACVVQLSSGDRAFVKVAGVEWNPDTPAMHRREARVAAAFPEGFPSPRFRGMVDTGDWVALAFDAVDGRMPHQPWRLDELDSVLRGIGEIARHATPSPVEVETAADALAGTFSVGWHSASTHDIDRLDPWARANLDRLVEVSEPWSAAIAGDSLLHLDLRADNILLVGSNTFVVDWAHAGVGASWFDIVGFLPSVVVAGGPPAHEVFARTEAGRHADPDAVTTALAATAGYFCVGALQPPPPGIPHVRTSQAQQGAAALEWLRHRM